MKTQNKHPIFSYVNIPLTSDLFNSIIEDKSTKNLAVIYSFQIGKDLYIGRTINLRSRLKEHWTSPFKERKKNSCRVLYSTVRKYHWDQFVFNILEIIPSNLLLNTELILITKEKEAEYIKNYQPTLNIISSHWAFDYQTCLKSK